MLSGAIRVIEASHSPRPNSVERQRKKNVRRKSHMGQCIITTSLCARSSQDRDGNISIAFGDLGEDATTTV